MPNFDVPAPFNIDITDIEQVFTDFVNVFDSKIVSLMQDVRNTSNGMEPLLNIIIAPVEYIEDMTQPFITLYNILNTYSQSWGDPLNFIGSILEAYLFVKFQLKTLNVITPDMFIRIIESTMSLSFANIKKNLDLRIMKLPIDMKFVESKYTMDNMSLSTNFGLNSLGVDLGMLKKIQRTKLGLFKENTLTTFTLFFTIVTLVFIGFKVYYDQRWKKLSI